MCSTRNAMQPRELVLRILRLNLIPAPRVIAPGPATEFPVLHVDAQGSGRVVKTLDEARALSQAVAGVSRDRSAGDFFSEILPIEETAEVAVSGLAGEWHRMRCGTSQPERVKAISLAVRATYALGLYRALVTIGFGPGGPWVVHVEPGNPEGCRSLNGTRQLDSRIRFLGARAEYIAVDPRTGRGLDEFFDVWVKPDGEPALPLAGEVAPGGDWRTPPATYLWISSPVPRRDMPLSTRFMFQGEPSSGFLRALDRSVAVLGMMVCRPDDVRERNGTGEGLLGSYRVTGEGSFEYTTVPSLLWSPRAMRRVCEAVAGEVERYNGAQGAGACIENGTPGTGSAARHGDPGEMGKFKGKHEIWSSHLERLYRWQRAYYHADKTFFSVPPCLPQDSAPGGDFRPLWGLDAPAFSDSCVTLGTDIVSAGHKSQGKGVMVRAGVRSALVEWENVLSPDVLEADDFNGGTSAWAPATLIRPNPTAARTLTLPEGAILRADVTSNVRCLRVGPIIGIMAPRLGKGQRFGIETDRFRHMVRLGAEMGLLVYVFFPEPAPGEGPTLDPVAGFVKGWTHRDRRGWSAEWLPLPDVVYDRHIPDPVTGGARDVAQEFSGACPQAVFINSLPLVRLCRDKLMTHDVLSGVPEIAAHLPVTEAVREASQAARFASFRRRAFLKLRGGTGTKGLALIENLGSRYRITRREKGAPPRVDEVQGQASLLRFLSDVLQIPAPGTPPRREPCPEFIIQEGIDLAPLPEGAGSAFEVRVVYQKGGAGVWLRTGMVVRANPEAEGFVLPGVELHHRVGDFLELALPGRVNEVKAAVRRVARMIPPVLERHSGRGGEISVDFGIDRNGKPWLIEVNSKPATLFRDIGAFELRKLTLLRVLNYAVALHRELRGI
ncbi:MAG: YheC/YheD family protein [Bacillota bacterium]